MAKKYDFGGYATKNDIKCADGRTIKHDAFKNDDGKIVPLVYMHSHTNAEDIIGHALLENRDDGVYCYGSFNNNPAALAAKEAVWHGDVNKLSIYANHLQHSAGTKDVIHGEIKEVSLVLAGANPGALIDTLEIEHAEDSEEEAIIYTDDNELIHGAPIWVNIISHSETDPDEPKEENKKKSEKDEEKEEAEKPSESEEKKEEFSEEKKEAEKPSESEEKKEESSEEKKEDEKADDEAKHDDLEHADNADPKAIYDTFTEDQKNAVKAIIMLLTASDKDIQSLNEEIEHAEEEIEHAESSNGKSIKEVWDSLNDQQKQLAVFIIGETVAEMNKNDEAEHSEGGNEMSVTKNLFEQNGQEQQEEVLSHDDMMAVISDITTTGSLKASALKHGITNLDVLFPDAQSIADAPIMVERDQDWVSDVLDGVSKSPFGRLKCIYADITGADARAKGFLGSTNHKDANGKPYRDAKGNIVDVNGNRVYKEEEVIPLTKRTVSPTTVYKKQRLDRNDIIDITDFDIVVWVKAEMKVMLNEEIARAILIGDGRAAAAADKVDETCIKPIWTDADFYTIKAPVTVEATDTDDTVASKLIDKAVLAKKDYKGSGSTVLFVNEDYLTRMLLLKDGMGHRLYRTEAELASAMRVTRIIPVPVFQGATRVDSDDKVRTLVGLIVNLKDYRVGTDKKGAVTMFDDFDINYNQEIYLIETRLSGMMVKPYAAIALETVPAAG